MTNIIKEKITQLFSYPKNRILTSLLSVTIKYYLFLTCIITISYLIQLTPLLHKPVLLIITLLIISIFLGLFITIKENPVTIGNTSRIKEFLKNAEKLYAFSLVEQEYCGWLKKRTYIELLKEAETEINEVLNAKTKKEITEELGDLYRDVLLTMIIAWRDNFSEHPSIVLENTYKKIKKRKPFVEKRVYVSEEEAIKIWNKAKNNEKKIFQK